MERTWHRSRRAVLRGGLRVRGLRVRAEVEYPPGYAALRAEGALADAAVPSG